MMKVCANSPSLRGRAAEYLAENSSDGEQSALSNGTPMQRAFLSQGKTMAAWKRFPFGMMCKPLTESLGEDLLMWFRADFLAKTYRHQEEALESTANEAECGSIWRELSVKFDPSSSSWKTHHCLLSEDLPWSSVTLPRWGMMRDGVLLERTTLPLPTKGTESGSWEATYPTPNTLDSAGSGRMNPNANVKKWGGVNSLGGMAATGMWPTPKSVQMWRTPTAHEWKNTGHSTQIHLSDQVRPMQVKNPKKIAAMGLWPTPQAGDSRATINTTTQNQKMLAHAVQKKVGDGGALNPDWTEWLMGWPVGWTDLKPLVMDRFLLWLDLHGVSCPKNK